MAADLTLALASRFLERLVCPTCRDPLENNGASLRCDSCGDSFPVRGSVLDLRPSGRTSVQGDQDAWSDHWSSEKQASFVQRFFSWYRKAVFARTVAYFIGRYFPAQGVFVEAGSGTSETSIRVNKRGGACALVALDLIIPVLESCNPVMDVRVGGDIFRLPFADDSVDGIWNVGVMEHFTHDQIDAILRELHRVMRQGARVILLWPGSNSIPQKMLEAAAWVINLRPRQRPFSFHPAEISRLRSSQQGRDVLARNGFETVTIDPGPRSLMAFVTVVGEKPVQPRSSVAPVFASGYSSSSPGTPTHA